MRTLDLDITHIFPLLARAEPWVVGWVVGWHQTPGSLVRLGKGISRFATGQDYQGGEREGIRAQQNMTVSDWFIRATGSVWCECDSCETERSDQNGVPVFNLDWIKNQPDTWDAFCVGWHYPLTPSDEAKVQSLSGGFRALSPARVRPSYAWGQSIRRTRLALTLAGALFLCVGSGVDTALVSCECPLCTGRRRLPGAGSFRDVDARFVAQLDRNAAPEKDTGELLTPDDYVQAELLAIANKRAAIEEAEAIIEEAERTMEAAVQDVKVSPANTKPAIWVETTITAGVIPTRIFVWCTWGGQPIGRGTLLDFCYQLNGKVYSTRQPVQLPTANAIEQAWAAEKLKPGGRSTWPTMGGKPMPGGTKTKIVPNQDTSQPEPERRVVERAIEFITTKEAQAAARAPLDERNAEIEERLAAARFRDAVERYWALVLPAPRPLHKPKKFERLP